MVKNSENRSRTISAGWRETIDGWVRDPTIRRHSLIALAMILAAATFIVSLATGALSATASSLLPSLLANTIVSVSTLGASGTGWWLLRRRRRARERGKPWEAVLNCGAVPASEVQGGDADPRTSAALEPACQHRPPGQPCS